jgi:hypothetical protein
MLGFFVVRALYRRYLHPLHTVPGPFLASITSLWFLGIYLGDDQQHKTPIKLHAQYGPIVRIRPNTVIINDPQHFGDLFTWRRSDFFLASRGDPHVVPHGAELDLDLHNMKKRRIMGGFAVSYCHS